MRAKPGPATVFPTGARFAFTIFDDADNATVANSAPVYAVLAKNGILTTKSVWVYPPRGRFAGESLLDPEYREWILSLKAQGFEIGLHNVGDGAFARDEILQGLEIFRDTLGAYPRVARQPCLKPGLHLLVGSPV